MTLRGRLNPRPNLLSCNHTHTRANDFTHIYPVMFCLFFPMFYLFHIVATGDVTAAPTCAEETVALLYRVGQQSIPMPVTNRAD